MYNGESQRQKKQRSVGNNENMEGPSAVAQRTADRGYALSQGELHR